MTERLSDDDLKDLAQFYQAPVGPQPGEVYRHFKGGIYSIVARAIKEDTLEPMVIYHSNLKGTNWARTLADFTENVRVVRGGENLTVPRFERLGD